MESQLTRNADLQGKVILVTGASSGLGRGVACVLGELGARVLLVGRDERRLQETASSLPSGQGIVCPYDVGQHDKTSAWMAALAKEHGAVHGLVHMAGINRTEPLRFVDMAAVNEVLNVNVQSCVSLVRAFRQKTVRAYPDARVVLASSISAFRGFVGTAAYSASKGAVMALTRQMAAELAGEKILVNAIAPGLVDTKMSRADRENVPEESWVALQQAHLLGVGVPEDIAWPVVFLLSHGARWMTGQTLVVDGGLTCH